MKKLLVLLAILSGVASAQSPVTVTGLIKTPTNIAASFGMVTFKLQPFNSSIAYRVAGQVMIGPIQSVCGIDATGHLKSNADLVSACQVWGNDVVSPTGTAYEIIESPNNGPGQDFTNALIQGASLDLSNLTFVPNVRVFPDLTSLTLGPLTVSLIPNADNLYSLGSGGDRFSQAYVNNAFITNYNTVSASSYNNVVEADTHSGATDTLKLQGCLADAITKKTACDARNFTDRTFTAEIDLGDASFDPVQLLLPCSGKWHFSMTDGTSYGIKQFSGTELIGCGVNNGGFRLNADSGSNLAVLYGTDPSPSSGGSYIYASGFIAYADSGSTIGTAVCNEQKTFDGSYFGPHTCAINSGATSAPKDFWAHATSFSTVMTGIVADAQEHTGSVPCTFGDPTVTTMQSLSAHGFSCAHAGSGQSEVVWQQCSTWTLGNDLSDVYMEGPLGTADTTTPAFNVTAACGDTGADYFSNIRLGSDVGGSTRYAVAIASGAKVIINGGISSSSGNFVNDSNANGLNITGTANSSIDGYNTPNVPMYINNATANIPTLTSAAATITTATLTTVKDTNAVTRDTITPAGGRNFNNPTGNGYAFQVNGSTVDSFNSAGGATFAGVTASGTSLVTLASTTVGALPSAASNSFAQIGVTDSTAVAAEGQTCVGGSSNKAIAISNGTVWKCF